jgi:Dockerin type I domain
MQQLRAQKISLVAIRLTMIVGIVAAAHSVRAATPVDLTGSTLTENFDSSVPGTTLPAGWAVSKLKTGGSTGINKYSPAAGTVDAAVTNLNSTSTGETYLFNSNGDGAVGILNSSNFTGPVAIYFGFTNRTAGVISDITFNWDYEKYRTGSREFDWTFFTSTDGSNFSSLSSGDKQYAPDSGNGTITFPPLSTHVDSITISGVNMEVGASYYFEWVMTGVGGSSNGQALGVDNFSLTATATGGGEGNTAGDINQDGHIDGADLSTLMSGLSDPTGFAAAHPDMDASEIATLLDVNGDGAASNADVQMLINDLKNGQGTASAVPEPASLVLAAIGCLGLGTRLVKTRRGGK